MKISKRNNNWLDKYNLLCAYYEYYKNTEVPQSFKTKDGINFDRDGIKLGSWVSSQRKAYQGYKTYRITNEKIELLKKINFRFDIVSREDKWQIRYNLAVLYFKHHEDLEIPYKFITTNGYEASKRGISLGVWLHTQKQKYKAHELSEDKIKLLENINISWEKKSIPKYWLKKYALARKYYEHHGNLEVPRQFKTINGYEYDPKGINLGNWIVTERQVKRGTCPCHLNDEQIKLLDDINMIWEMPETTKRWLNSYKIASNYSNHYGNINVKQYFKTSDGITYDENGLCLAKWLEVQKLSYRKGILNDEQIKLLERIGMSFNELTHEDIWMKKYKLASIYFNHYGNLEIPERFKTKDGINYDSNGIALGSWLETQKQAYKGTNKAKINDKQIELLEKINITWYKDIYNDKFELTEITDKNTKRYQIELLSRFKSLLNSYQNDTMPSKEEINKEYIRRLNK